MGTAFFRGREKAMPSGGRDLHELTCDLAGNQDKRYAVFNYVILFHFIVISANLWRSKGTVAACSTLFAQSFHTIPLRDIFHSETPQNICFQHFTGKNTFNTKSVLTTSTWVGLTDLF